MGLGATRTLIMILGGSGFLGGREGGWVFEGIETRVLFFGGVVMVEGVVAIKICASLHSSHRLSAGRGSSGL